VRILEALNILEAAVIECKTRDIDTPEVREALDVLAPHCRPEWLVAGFRSSLKRIPMEFGPGGEGQQQNLRVNFSGIYRNVRQLLQRRVAQLETQQRRSKDAAVAAELNRLKAELERMPARWDFVNVLR
jgi:hypothetical protein